MGEPSTRPPPPSRSTLVEWARLLKFFRYYRHYGGHSVIEDEFVVALARDAFTRELGEQLRAMARAKGQAPHIDTFDDRVLVGVTDAETYGVTPRSLQASIELESLLAPLAGALLEPPIDSRHCFSPTRHPELWTGHR
jgi:hypothetical protein